LSLALLAKKRLNAILTVESGAAFRVKDARHCETVRIGLSGDIMVSYIHAFFAAAPLAAVALAVALGYLAGRIRIGTFVLGPVAATLLVAIAPGQAGVSVSGEVKTLAFALFIYALGYMIGPFGNAHLRTRR
jgi:hypothetical protein